KRPGGLGWGSDSSSSAGTNRFKFAGSARFGFRHLSTHNACTPERGGLSGRSPPLSTAPTPAKSLPRVSARPGSYTAPLAADRRRRQRRRPSDGGLVKATSWLGTWVHTLVGQPDLDNAAGDVA